MPQIGTTLRRPWVYRESGMCKHLLYRIHSLHNPRAIPTTYKKVVIRKVGEFLSADLKSFISGANNLGLVYQVIVKVRDYSSHHWLIFSEIAILKRSAKLN